MATARDPGLLEVVASLALLAGVAVLDALTGTRLGFFVFYFLPVAYAALVAGQRGGISMALAAALAWGVVEHFDGEPRDLFLLWNGAIRLAAFACMGIGVARIQSLLARERELNDKLQHTLARVHQLKGLLPICGSCKRIRNDQGYWERLERYLEAHSEAEFTHHLCPDCYQRLIPDEKPAA